MAGELWSKRIDTADFHIYHDFDNMIRINNRIIKPRFVWKHLRHWFCRNNYCCITHLRVRRLKAYDLKEYIRFEIVLMPQSLIGQYSFFVLPCTVYEHGKTYIMHLIIIQRFLKNTLKKMREKRVALCMGQHASLGLKSPLCMLSMDLLRHIIGMSEL